MQKIMALSLLAFIFILGVVRYSDAAPVDLTIKATATVKPYILLSRITAYNPVSSQTDSSPDISSCGKNLPNQIALSQDLFFKNGVKQCGLRVDVYNSHGKLIVKDAVVWDTMNKRYHHAADILMASDTQALQFGVQKGYLIISSSLSFERRQYDR